jgi:hypothetical protein
MKYLLKLGIGQFVPALYFGIAVFEFVRTKNLAPILFFGALGLAFMLLASKKNSRA